MSRSAYQEEDVRRELFRLGITMRYIGYHYAKDALLLLKEDESRIYSVTKCLYPEIARKYSTSISAVERDIRTLSLVAWKNQRQLLEKMAGHPLERRPTSSHFLAIVYAYLAQTPFILDHKALC